MNRSVNIVFPLLSIPHPDITFNDSCVFEGQADYVLKIVNKNFKEEKNSWANQNFVPTIYFLTVLPFRYSKKTNSSIIDENNSTKKLLRSSWFLHGRGLYH